MFFGCISGDSMAENWQQLNLWFLLFFEKIIIMEYLFIFVIFSTVFTM